MKAFDPNYKLLDEKYGISATANCWPPLMTPLWCGR